MSRPVAYNKVSEPINGSIVNGDDVGNIVYTVDGVGNDYPGGYADRLWVPSAEGAAPIVFVTDTFTQNYTGDPQEAVPIFFSCAGTSSAAIIYTANRLPGMEGQDFSTAEEALDYVTRNGYFILEGNDPFEGINADSLVLDVDAAKMSSYPQTGTAWYDLSGNQNTGALTNGPTFNSKGYLEFDGVNDYALMSSNVATLLNGKTEASLNMLVKIDSNTNSVGTSGIIQLSGYNSSNGNLYWYNNNFTYLDIFRTSRVEQVWNNSIIDPRNWHMLTITTTPGSEGWKAYLNGQLRHSIEGQSTVSVRSDIQGGLTIGRNSSSRYLAGEIKNIQIYDRALSETEVKQNYFGSPIVTDGLVFAVDANNIVSYPKSGTTWYNLTSSITSGSLNNGPTFSQANGGSIVFDGTNDVINTNFTQTFINELTVETWYRGTKTTRNHLWNFGSSVADNLHCNFNDTGYTLWVYWQGGGSPAIFFTSPNFTDNNIHHLVFRHSGSVNQVYLDGQLLTPIATSGTQTFTGGGVGGAYNIGGNPNFGGNVYANRVYNRALTASEILQNYQAEQYRFAGPQGLIETGLVVHLDAMNLDSYPGTGNTWFDLSGNGNNATRNGATGNPTWNQTNGWYFYASVNGVNGGLTIANSATIQNLTDTTVFLVVAMETKSVISGDSDWMAMYSKFASDQRIAISVNQVDRYLHIEVPGATNSATIFNNADYTGTKYNIIAARVYSSGTTGWLNGNQISTSATTTTGNTGPIYLGHDVNNEMFKGSMKAALTYNRALSDSEMGQVFTYLNSKFNVY